MVPSDSGFGNTNDPEKLVLKDQLNRVTYRVVKDDVMHACDSQAKQNERRVE